MRGRRRPRTRRRRLSGLGDQSRLRIQQRQAPCLRTTLRRTSSDPAPVVPLNLGSFGARRWPRNRRICLETEPCSNKTCSHTGGGRSLLDLGKAVSIIPLDPGGHVVSGIVPDRTRVLDRAHRWCGPGRPVRSVSCAAIGTADIGEPEWASGLRRRGLDKLAVERVGIYVSGIRPLRQRGIRDICGGRRRGSTRRRGVKILSRGRRKRFARDRHFYVWKLLKCGNCKCYGWGGVTMETGDGFLMKSTVFIFEYSELRACVCDLYIIFRAVPGPPYNPERTRLGWVRLRYSNKNIHTRKSRIWFGQEDLGLLLWPIENCQLHAVQSYHFLFVSWRELYTDLDVTMSRCR